MNKKIMPKFLLLLSFVELWERFSYYGMRALLVLYLTSTLGFTDADSYNIYFLFAAIGYTGPVIFGFLSDKFFGFRHMIIVGGIIMALGHTIMALTCLDHNLIYLGLALIAFGTGAFKGNITTLLGTYYPGASSAREKGFMIFYMSVNLGSLIASVACGIIANQYGWHYGFGLAGVGMVIGLLTFVKFIHILEGKGNKPKNIDDKQFSKFKIRFLGAAAFGIAILTWALTSAGAFTTVLNYIGSGILLYYLYLIFNANSEDKLKLFVILLFMLFMTLFYAIEMQLGSLINLFAERNVERSIFGLEIPAAVSQAINPLSIIIIGLFTSTCLKLSPKYQFVRFGVGMSTMSICFIILYFSCLNADQFGKTSYIMFVIGLAPMGLGELLIGAFSQSQVALLAPEKNKGFVMGMLMLSLAFANLLGSIVAKFMTVPTVHGTADALVSLEIYKNGFLKIAIYNMAFVGLFILVLPIMSKAYKKNLHCSDQVIT